MSQSDSVKEKILSHGLNIASARGLHALSFGDLARDLEVSRAGLLGHFASKEVLQLAVLQKASALFVVEVTEPAMAAPEGPGRVRELFVRWLSWSRSARLKGGCPFVQASADADALPDIVREALKASLDQWSEVLRQAIIEAKGNGFKPDLDIEQLVFELYGLYLSHHFWHWSMRDRQAERRTFIALDRLLADLRA